jgi:acyl-CoA dehydrogenase
MTIRAFNEAGRAFLLWAALKSDVAHRAEDAGDRECPRK